MGNLTLKYVARRFAIFLLTVWLSATIIFIVPRLAPGDPVQAMIARMSAESGSVAGGDEIVRAWRERFGLNDPMPIQYLRYLSNLATFNLGPSLANFPTTVASMVGRALPWTLGLLTVATAIFFTVGNFLGALLAWRRTPALLRLVIPVTMIFTSVPAVLASILMIYVFAFLLRWFPFSGAYGRGMLPELSLDFISSVLYHGILPATAIVIVTFGYWTLGMRGMMVTIEGEDYMILARAKGLNPLYVLYRYMIRNAILPQLTALALTVGTLVGGAVLVEVVFTYPGMGLLIFRGITSQDFAVIQGTSYILILTTALAVLIIDLAYPLIDPRIQREGS